MFRSTHARQSLPVADTLAYLLTDTIGFGHSLIAIVCTIAFLALHVFLNGPVLPATLPIKLFS